MRGMLPGKQGMRGSSDRLHAFGLVIIQTRKAVLDDRFNDCFPPKADATYSASTHVPSAEILLRAKVQSLRFAG